jgi:hypothetical protein
MAVEKPLRILHLEDDPNDAEIIRQTMIAAGIACETVRIVESQSDFVKALAGEQFDLILADYRLPAFDGLSALALARHHHPDVPFIIVSGTMGEEAAIDSLKAGATDYVLKNRLSRLTPSVTRAIRECEERVKRKQAEAELRESEERYRALYEDNPSMFFTVNPEGKVISVNPFGASQLGYRIEELVGQSVLNVFHPEDRAAVWEQFRVCAQNPLQVYQWQFRKVRKDESIIWVEEFARAVRSPQGPLNVLIVCHDITERKQAEEALRKTEEQLNHSQKMEAIGRLAGGIAHDFNNLLTAILGYSELLLNAITKHDPSRNDIEEIKRAAERATSLTNQLLAFSRKQVMQPKILDLNAVVAVMDKMLRRLIGEDIELITIFGPGLGRVSADPGQIEQVIMNLAVNARDAMPDGGKLTIETANVEFDEAYARERVAVIPGRYIMLAMSDTGCGMDAETQSHLFEPFFTTKEPGKGTGLGLSTVYGIIKQSGGNIWVYSEPGSGTTFKIYLPRVDSPLESTKRDHVAIEMLHGSETVLLVEDEDIVRELACRVLQMYGYNVLAARSGMEALLICERHPIPIHLLVTDVVMPKMNGRELAKRLKALYPKMRVLFTSGYTGEAINRHGDLEPDFSFLQKPFTPDILVRKIRELLDKENLSR